MDKTDWGEGPWINEPDEVSWVDSKTKLECLAKRNRMGAWCGYVAIPPEHILYGSNYDELDVDVHGGLTFSGHLDKPHQQSFYFGFDCCHITDRLPAFEARHKDLFGDESTFVVEWATYKTLAYCRAEVEYLAAQLARVAVTA